MSNESFIAEVKNPAGEFVGKDDVVYKVDTVLDNTYTGNKTLFATSPDRNRVAIKIFKQNQGARREWAGLNMTYSAGVSVPRPISLISDEHDSLCVVMQKVDGINLLKIDDLALRHRAGEMLRAVHEVVRVDGKEWTKTGKYNFSFYDDRIASCLTKLDSIHDNSRAHALISQFAASISSDFSSIEPVFNHNDIYDGQFIYTPQYNLVLIDFELWKEGSPYDDIAMYVLHSLRLGRPVGELTEFIKGYAKNYALTDKEKAFLSFFLVYAGLRTVDFFSRFKPALINSSLEQLTTILNFIDSEYLWKYC